MYDRTPKPPADVKHPCGLYREADILRAKANIQTHAWAQDVMEHTERSAQFWLDCPDDQLPYWIPETTPFRVVDCPVCGTGWRYAWNHLDGDRIQCGNCEFTWPHPDYVETETHTFTDPLGVLHTIPYYKGTPSTVHGSAASEVYRLSGRVRYSREGRLSRLGAVGKLYALTGDLGHARVVRKVLLRLAHVYPHYMAHDWNNVYEDYGNLQSGKLSGWKLHDAGVFRELATAYDLTYNSGVYSDTDKVTIEEGCFREFLRLMTATSPRGCCVNDGPAAMAAGVLAGLMLGDHAAIAWAVEPPNGFIGFVRDYFRRDGHWYEASPSYEGMTLGPFWVTPEALRGYSDPPGYTRPDRYDGLDLLDQPLMRKILIAGSSEGMPDGRLPANNDSTFRSTYPANRAEVNHHWYPSDRNLQLMAWALGDADELKGSEYALFRRDPDLSLSDVQPLSPSSESLVRPGIGWAILRTGDGPADAAMVLDYGDFGSGHGHPDRLNLTFYDYGKELVTDLGYLGWGHPYHPWMRTTLAHNQVIVDGAPQAKAGGHLEGFGARNGVHAVIASGREVYPDLVDRYRRTVIMVDHGPGKRYLVDAFEVHGGRDHQYMIHADGETFRPPDLDYAEVDPADLGHRHTGYDWLKEARSGRIRGPFACEWISDPDRGLGTRLHHLGIGPADLIHGRAPGLRDRSSPFGEVELHKVIIRRPGPTSMFLSVIEAFTDASEPVSVEPLEIRPEAGHARAVRVTSGQLTDIVINGDEQAAEGACTLPEYPDLRFRGRVGLLSLRDGKPVHLWMLGGTEIGLGVEGLVCPTGRYEGTVLSKDQAGYSVTLDAVLPEDTEGPDRYLVITGRTDGAYRIDEILLHGDATVVKLADEPRLDFEPGDRFTLMPSASSRDIV